MSKFIISTDSCADKFKSYLDEKNVHCIILRRITDGVISEELYDSYAEYEEFFDSIKKGALPTTSQLNPAELEEHFLRILDKEKNGDIIHISLSGGLSNTFNNSALAAQTITESTGRKVYAFDSLSAALGMGLMLDRLIELRDAGETAENALRILENLREHTHVWAIVGNLFHLKRGGRISGFKAAVGTLLNVRPVLIINDKGKLTIERTVKGSKKSIEYVVQRFAELGVQQGIDYSKSKVYVVHASAAEEAAMLKELLSEYVPEAQIVEGMVGPIIGTHIGAGAVAFAFEGAKRLCLSEN